MTMTRINRRQLLAATGLGTASLFLPSLVGRSARAQSNRIKRLVIFVTQHGVVRETWWMRRGNPALEDWEYPFDDPNPDSFSETLRPLHPHRRKLLVLEGLSQMSTIGDRATNNHDAAVAHLLCADRMVSGDNAGGPSVDQIIAREVARPDRFRSLELASGGLFKGGMVNQGPNQRLPVEMSPHSLFGRLFPGGETPSSEPSERDRIRGARRSVLDFVQDEYRLVAPRLSREDAVKLEMHREIIRDLELRIEAMARISCENPGAPDSSRQRAHQFADLIAAAFACDLTRVVTLQMAQLHNHEFGAPPGDVHQDFAHQTRSSPHAAQQMTNYNKLHAEHFAYLLEALDRYSDGDGTLLDNTAAVWLTELATGPHDLFQIPVVMGGSAGGSFRTGRYVSYAQNLPNPSQNPNCCWETRVPLGPGHSHLLVSLCQAMGLERNHVGLTEVVTRDGKNEVINLTGPLPRLT